MWFDRAVKAPETLHYTADPEANALIARDATALLIGFCLDQQVTVQKAFAGPLAIQQRLGTIDARELAALPPSQVEDAFKQKPAVHRFPGSMAKRVQELCAALASEYDGDASRVWNEAQDGADLRARLLALPGIGELKATSILAILAKRFGLKLKGLEEVVPSHPTLGDVDSPQALERYQAQKRARKAALKDA
jgi:uncharacterized HhH-GPD family protein